MRCTINYDGEYEKAMKSKDDVDTLCCGGLELSLSTMRRCSRPIKAHMGHWERSTKMLWEGSTFMSNNPNTSSDLFDKLHNEISDRDEAINRLNTEVATQEESLMIVLNEMPAKLSAC